MEIGGKVVVGTEKQVQGCLEKDLASPEKLEIPSQRRV